MVDEMSSRCRPRLLACAVLVSVALGVQTVVAAPLPARAAGPAKPYDFNGDGYADLAVGVPGDGKISAGGVNVLYGSKKGLTAKGAQLWSQASRGIKGEPSEQEHFGDVVTSGDFDCDGRADLAVGTQDKVAVIYGGRRGLTTRDQLMRAGLGSFEGSRANVEHLAAGDFDRDGCHDLVAAGEGRLAAIEGTKRGLRGAKRIVLPRSVVHPDEWYTNAVGGDVTGDGTDDLVLGGGDNPQNRSEGVVLVPGSGGGLQLTRARRIDTPPSPVVSDRPFFGWGYGSGLAVGDFNGDHRPDLAVGDPTAGTEQSTNDYDEPVYCPSLYFCSGAVVVLMGTRSGLSAANPQVWTKSTLGREHQTMFGLLLATGDVNADRRDDLAVSTGGSVTIMRGSPQGLTSRGMSLWHLDSPGVQGRSLDGSFGCGTVRLLDHGRGPAADLSAGIEDYQESTGAVSVLYGSAHGVTATGDQLWQQSSRGVPGAAQDGDQFGGTRTCDVDDG